MEMYHNHCMIGKVKVVRTYQRISKLMWGDNVNLGRIAGKNKMNFLYLSSSSTKSLSHLTCKSNFDSLFHL